MLSRMGGRKGAKNYDGHRRRLTGKKKVNNVCQFSSGKFVDENNKKNFKEKTIDGSCFGQKVGKLLIEERKENNWVVQWYNCTHFSSKYACRTGVRVLCDFWCTYSQPKNGKSLML